MTRTAKQPDSMAATLIAGLAMLGWAAAVVIRTLRGVEVDLVQEGPVICLAVGVLHAKLSGRNGAGPPEGGAGA